MICISFKWGKLSQIIRERSVRATKSFTILVSEVPKNRRGRPAENQVEKYVPTFMKEVLAKSFLKDPDNYLAHLKAKERAKERIINNLRPQLPNENNQRGRADKPPGSPRPNVVEGQGSRPRPWPGQELKFDSKFPWNPNTYDDSGRKFKGGYVFNKNDLAYNLDHQQQVRIT